MTFDEYQQLARETAIYPDSHAVLYPALGLAGEAGEVCNKVKKIVRDDCGAISPERRASISHEIGDVLWYLAALASDLGISLGQIADANIAMLRSRKSAGSVRGDGDNR